MRKEKTLKIHKEIVNDVMNYIYEYIDTDINIDELAFNLQITKQHLHKIFKEQMKINIYEFVKSIRLQKASSLLLTNKNSTISKIANMCGYSSHTSFIKAFRKHFDQTPKEWKNGGYIEYSASILNNHKVTPSKKDYFESLEPNIIKTKQMNIYYIRHRGYKRKEVTKIWQQIQSCIYENDVQEYEEIGIYYDNPIITPSTDCFYLAGIILKDDNSLLNKTLSSFVMKESLYACFDIKGKQGDVLKFVQWVYHRWLPISGFITGTKPSFGIFKKNQFLEKDGSFEGRYYLPIRYI